MKTENSLANLKIGATARVVAVAGDDAVARRLLEMGVVPGATVRVVKTAPFGCPLEIRIRHSHLAVRRAEAETILIEE